MSAHTYHIIFQHRKGIDFALLLIDWLIDWFEWVKPLFAMLQQGEYWREYVPPYKQWQGFHRRKRQKAECQLHIWCCNLRGRNCFSVSSIASCSQSTDLKRDSRCESVFCYQEACGQCKFRAKHFTAHYKWQVFHSLRIYILNTQTEIYKNVQNRCSRIFKWIKLYSQWVRP